jgi:hypothetical protein
MSTRGRRVTASQVGHYVFCARAWWLNVVEGRHPTDMEVIDAGTDLHERHGWQVSLARGSGKLALILLGIALLSTLIWAVTYVVR